MGLTKEDLCWKGGKESGTFICALREYSQVLQLWEMVPDDMCNWLNCDLPGSPRMYILGNTNRAPHLKKKQPKNLYL